MSYVTPLVANASPMMIVVKLGEEEEGDENHWPDHPESRPALEEIPINKVPIPVPPPLSSTHIAIAVSTTCCIQTLGCFKKLAPYWIATGVARVWDNTRGCHCKVYG
jgi:hypothetical protein